MNDYLMPLTFLTILFFLGSWALLHILIAAHKSGVLFMRETAYYRNDSRRFHGSDFMAIMILYAILGMFILFLFSITLAMLSSYKAGLIITSTLCILNMGFALRRAPTKQAKPNTSFSIISIYGVAIIMTTTTLCIKGEKSDYLIELYALTSSATLAILHFIRLKSGKFYYKFRKRVKKTRSTNANASGRPV